MFCSSAILEILAQIKSWQSNSRSMKCPKRKYIKTEKSHNDWRYLEMSSEKGMIWIHKKKNLYFSDTYPSGFFSKELWSSLIPFLAILPYAGMLLAHCRDTDFHDVSCLFFLSPSLCLFNFVYMLPMAISALMTELLTVVRPDGESQTE